MCNYLVDVGVAAAERCSAKVGQIKTAHRALTEASAADDAK